jgi:hypothetical protein
VPADAAAPDVSLADTLDAAQDTEPSAIDAVLDADGATELPDAAGTDVLVTDTVDAIPDAILDVIPDVIPDTGPDAGGETIADAGPDTPDVPEVASDSAIDATPACDDKPPEPVSQADTMCKPTCPLPYPCYCGTCPWLDTEPVQTGRYANKWTQLTAYGAVADDRWGEAIVYTGTELMEIGGSGGGKYVAQILADGKRIALDPTNTGAP